MTNTQLFVGQPQTLGGLSNERDLAELCPEKFKGTTDWSRLASWVILQDEDYDKWDWVSDDRTIRKHQLDCLSGLLGSSKLKDQDIEAVAGWMLSEILAAVPCYLPAEESSDS